MSGQPTEHLSTTAGIKQIRETDLYAPIRDYLLEQGFTVRSEVLGCDITAVRGDELLVVELKRTPNITLLIQAVQRQKFSSSVYVAILEPAKRTRHYRGVRQLVKQLRLGLITVRFGKLGPRVTVVLDPPTGDPQPAIRPAAKHRQALLKEFNARSGDYNVGGSHRQTLITAYREEAIMIAYCLDKQGPLSPRQLRQLGTADRTGEVLIKNYYGWFHRIKRGLYEITGSGRTELMQYPDIVRACRKHMGF